MIMKKITVIGSGALGTALANILIDSGQTNVVVYGIDQQELQDLEKGMNTKYFQDYRFHKMKTSNDLNDALSDAHYVVLAIPSIVIDDILEAIIKKSPQGTLIINGCKGFYPKTQKPLHSGIEAKIKKIPNIRGVVSILGPSFASEMIKKSLTTIVAVSSNDEQLQEVQKMFYTSYFKLYAQKDIIGAEVGGIYKNVLAIGAGMLVESGYKINTLASYLTRGLSEMSRFNQFMGGKEKTIFGLTGLGDLILTATDNNSRNFSFGREFIRNGKGKTENITLEGLTALNVVEEIRKKNHLNLPIARSIYNIIFNNSDLNKEIA